MVHSSGFGVAEALDAPSVDACRALFAEYQEGLGVSLCFQGFEQELATLPGAYARPRGRLLLARIVGEPAGCVAMRALSEHDAEMKRLYIRAPYRGMGLGRVLAECAVDEARALGYSTLKLDTLPGMAEAQHLYRELGFIDCAPYNDNPVAGVRYMSLTLAKPVSA
ncbi:MAG: GNAT family N-acetyltransferase [Burkholderiales bacterium]|nr:GNAT family N-acetyltransferase [Burkholderiales bacterium]